MTKTYSYEEFCKEIDPKILAAAKRKAKKMKAIMLLHELRQARRLSQEQLAAVLHIKQSSVSKLERRADMYITTLRDFIRAMGGELEIKAIFPEGSVLIEQFHQV